VLEVRVREHGAVAQQPLEAAGVVGPEARQVVVAELIDGDEEHQPHRRGRRRLRHWQCGGESDEREDNCERFLHRVTNSHGRRDLLPFNLSRRGSCSSRV
jgi:hypothetical protein